MHKADIILAIIYNMKEQDKCVIKTNTKREAIGEILEAWLQCQIGQGEDLRPAKERDVYNIFIDLDLSDDTFYTSSDTGNKGLTARIVADVFARLTDIKIEERKREDIIK